jgi:hypothetical protein
MLKAAAESRPDVGSSRKMSAGLHTSCACHDRKVKEEKMFVQHEYEQQASLRNKLSELSARNGANFRDTDCDVRYFDPSESRHW